MNFENAKLVLDSYLRHKSLKASEQRYVFLQVFLEADKHLTPEEFYLLVKKRIPKVGIATIYRTLKLFCESNIASELKLSDGKSRYEPALDDTHHDHLICTSCGVLVEIYDDEIEKLQEKLAKANNFVLKSHRLELYGLCKNCQPK